MKSQKQTKAFFKVSQVLPCFEMNCKLLERHKKPLSLAETRKRENPVNAAHKMVSKSSFADTRTDLTVDFLMTFWGARSG